MIIEHYTQTIDLGENGRIECTRDDTPEEVKFHLIAWKDEKKTHELKIRYNIMYDYDRFQHFWNGQLIEDVLEAGYHYGHLMEEWCNEIKWKDNFEPVSPYGCEMYQEGNWCYCIPLPENRVETEMMCSPYGIAGILRTGKILDTEELSDYGAIQALGDLEKDKQEFDPIKAREKRLLFYTEKNKELNMTYSEWLQTEVPIDMSMVD